MDSTLWGWVMSELKTSTERVRKWRAMNEERKKELSRKSSKAYRERHKDDPEYIKRERETSRRSSAKYDAKKRAAMTPEELEEFRRKTRERVAAIRAQKKLEKEKNNEQ